MKNDKMKEKRNTKKECVKTSKNILSCVFKDREYQIFDRNKFYQFDIYYYGKQWGCNNGRLENTIWIPKKIIREITKENEVNEK